MTPRLALVLLVLGGASSVRAEEQGEPLSLQGFSGALNTPTAWTHASGTAHFLYTNEEDPRYRTGIGSATFLASLSPIQFFEAGVRLSEMPRCCRDLSLNAKLQIPLQLLWPDLPVGIAIGAQDFAGAVPFFQTRYAVASGRWRWFRGSLGYGLGPDRMKGFFGSAEIRPIDEVNLLGEYDGTDWNAGVRLLLPVQVGPVPLHAGVVAKTALSNRPGFVEWGASLSAPLDLGFRTDTPVTALSATAFPVANRPRSLESIQQALIDFGFEDVRVGTHGQEVVVEYENNVLNHSEVDGLGVVLGALAEGVPEGFNRFSITTLRRQVALIETRGEVAALESWLGLAPASDAKPFPETVEFSIRPGRRSDVAFLSDPLNRSNWRSRLTLSPGIRPFIGTEVGVFDAVFSVRPEATVVLWRGAAVYARWDLPVAWTENFNDKQPLSPYRGGPKLDYAMLYQSLPLAPQLTALVGAGVYRVVSAGGVGQLLWTPFGGAHAFGLEGSLTRTNAAENKPSLTASWRWTFARLDAVLRVEAGQFVEGDRGVSAQASRFFGDVEVGAFYAQTDHAILGAFVSLPLTPRKDMRPGLVQFAGSRRWQTELYTVVREPNVNRIRVGVALPPVSPYNLESTFFDESRLSAAQLRAELPRARQAFERFRVPAVDRDLE